MKLSKVTNKLAKLSYDCLIVNPATNESYSERINLHYSQVAPNVTKPAFYDIEAYLSSDSVVEEGFLIKIDELNVSYIVSALSKRVFLNEHYKTIAELLMVEDFVDIKRSVVSEDAFGNHTETESIIYGNVPIKMAKGFIDLAGVFQTVKENFVVLLPKLFSVEMNDYFVYKNKEFKILGFEPSVYGIQQLRVLQR